MSIFSQLNKVNAKLNATTAKVGGAIIQGVSKVKALEAIGPNAINTINNTIKTAVSMSDNIERQIKETYLGRKALEGINQLSTNIVDGVINPSNAHIFQDPALMKGLVNLDSKILNGSVGAFADVANMHASLYPVENTPYDQLTPTQTGSVQSGVWAYQSAGAELANTKSNAYTPKYSFQFIVEIQLASELMGVTTLAAQKSFTFLATEVDRPSIKYSLEEANNYNFRFMYAKRMSFDNVNVVLLDDNNNDAMRLMSSIIKSISPILNSGNMTNEIEEINGLAFSNQQGYYDKTNNSYMASLGPVQNSDIWANGGVSDTVSPISSIAIYHLYDKSGFVNMYRYINPKILSVDFDKLSMTDTSNQTNIIKFSFAYDWVNMIDSITAAEQKETLERSISQAQLVVDSSTPKTAIPQTPVSASDFRPYSPQTNIRLPSSVTITPIAPRNISSVPLSAGPVASVSNVPPPVWVESAVAPSIDSWINDVEEA